DKPATHARVHALLSRTAIPAGSLIVLPEMFATGFSMSVARIAEEAGGETHAFLRKLAAQHKSFVLAGVVTRAADGRGRNEAVVFGPEGRELARYCKLHPFSYGGETRHYMLGERVATVACREFQLAPFVCYDLRFPEIFRRAVRG